MTAALALLLAAVVGGPINEAEIRFVEGPGPVPLLLSLRGGSALLVESVGIERAVGVYRVEVAANDPIFAALAALPEKAQGPPLIPDVAVVAVTLHTPTGERSLIAGRPTVDPKVEAMLTEVARLIQRAHAHPLGTVAMSVMRPKSPRSATLHLETTGEPDVEIRLTDGTPRVETTPQPAAPTPGVTPLPPDWTAVTGKKTKPLALRVKAGQHRDVAVPIAATKVPYFMRATFTGKLVVQEKGQPDMAGPVELFSKPLEIPK